METQNKEKNEEISNKAARIVEEIQKGNWSSLTELIIVRMMRGIDSPVGMRGKIVQSIPNGKEIIAKVRDELLNKKILAMKYEGRGYDVFEVYGKEKSSEHNSCLVFMRFDLGIIARQDLQIQTVLGGRELVFSSLGIAINFAEAYRISHEKILGYRPRIKICEISIVRYI